MNTTNQTLQKLISELKNTEISLFGRVASDLEKPSRKRREVNLSKLNNVTNEGEMIIVPGKVLGGGDINHKLTISAFKFSDGAVEKLKKSGSTIIPMEDITKEDIKGRRIRIIG
jgi:large subunit ribosomal protein L18e